MSAKKRTTRKGKPIHIYLPIISFYGAIDPEYMNSVLHLVSNINGRYKLSVGYITDSLIVRARNNAAAIFMANPEYTHMMFIDCDIVFKPHFIDRLLSLDEPLVAGIYPMKKLDFAPVYNELPEMETDEKGLYILKEIGTGFMMIRRDCIENIIEKGLVKTYKPQRNEKTKEMVETVYHLFPVEVVDDNGFQYLESEDYGFCRLHREAGGQVKGDALCALDHVGRIKYPVMPKRLLEAYEHNKECIIDDKELD